MAKFRAAIVGAGKIAGLMDSPHVTHAQAMTDAGCFSLEGVCEPDDERRDAFSERWRVPRCHAALDDLMADGEWDLVAVCSPDHTHADLLRRLLTAGKPPRLVVLEKPPCCSRDELKQLASLVDRPVAVNLSRRFDAGHLALEDMIARKELGEPVNVRWVYYGGWMKNGIHAVDTLSLLLGDGIEVRSARMGHDGGPGDPCLEGEFSTATYPHVPIAIESFPEAAYQLFEGEIRFTEGRARLLDFGNEILIDRVRVNEIGERELKASEPLRPDRQEPAMRVFYKECAGFLDTGSGTVFDRAGLATALDSMGVVFEARERVHP